jgi:membrane protease YdiL (CAAX protease family)
MVRLVPTVESGVVSSGPSSIIGASAADGHYPAHSAAAPPTDDDPRAGGAAGERRFRLRRAVLVATPALVPLSMIAVFALLRRRASPNVAYNVGFAVYWAGWCVAFPVWAVGPQRLVHGVVHGPRPTRLEAAVLSVPPLGAAAVELWSNRALVDLPTAAVMVSTGVVNGIGEELLWREVFLEEFPEDVLRGALWPLVGFALWHLAPQVILPSRRGRWRFVAGAAVVGACSTFSSWRSGSIRNSVGPHALTDACGVTAARFRLGFPAGAG